MSELVRYCGHESSGLRTLVSNHCNMNPVRNRRHGEPELLVACYRNSLALAAETGCKSIAFPCISTGIYGYPIEDAAKIAVGEVEQFITQRRKDAECAESWQNGRTRSPVSPERSESRKRSLEECAPQARGAVALRQPIEVVFCCFSERDAALYDNFIGKDV